MIALYFVQFKFPGEPKEISWHTLVGSDGKLWKGGRERAVDYITDLNAKDPGCRFRILPVKTVRKGGL